MPNPSSLQFSQIGGSPQNVIVPLPNGEAAISAISVNTGVATVALITTTATTASFAVTSVGAGSTLIEFTGSPLAASGSLSVNVPAGPTPPPAVQGLNAASSDLVLILAAAGGSTGIAAIIGAIKQQPSPGPSSSSVTATLSISAEQGVMVASKDTYTIAPGASGSFRGKLSNNVALTDLEAVPVGNCAGLTIANSATAHPDIVTFTNGTGAAALKAPCEISFTGTPGAVHYTITISAP